MLSNFYVDFENKFRGSRQDIIKRLSSYDELLGILGQSNTEIKTLDIGCGRGEFLEKSVALGFDAIGIDSNKEMVDFCKDLGFNVFKVDALEYLGKIENESLDLISIFHVIEHITHENLLELIYKCYGALRPNGILLIETPSIDNIQVSTRTFYLDPTHINQINPELLNFLLSKAGFHRSDIFYINGSSISLNSNPPNLLDLYKSVAQDLLSISVKSPTQAKNIFEDNNSWITKLNRSIETTTFLVDYDAYMKEEIYNLKLINSSISDRLEVFESKLSQIKEIAKFFKIFTIIKILKKLKNFFLRLSMRIFIDKINFIFHKAIRKFKNILKTFFKTNIRFLESKSFNVNTRNTTAFLKNSFQDKYYKRFEYLPKAKLYYRDLLKKSKLKK